MTWALAFLIVGSFWSIAFMVWALFKYEVFGARENLQIKDLTFVLMEIKILLEEILRR